MKVRFWGVRGSCAAPGPETARYGGNTSCVEIRLDDGQVIILDSGTGIRPLGSQLLKETGLVDNNVVEDPDWNEYWDFMLESLLKDGSWDSSSYDEDDKNCFSFVLTFVKSLKHDPLSSIAGNKLDFCKHFILPKTTLAAKFICLHRKMIDGGRGTHSARLAGPARRLFHL